MTGLCSIKRLGISSFTGHCSKLSILSRGSTSAAWCFTTERWMTSILYSESRSLPHAIFPHRRGFVSCVRQNDPWEPWIYFLQGTGARARTSIRQEGIRTWSYPTNFRLVWVILPNVLWVSAVLLADLQVRQNWSVRHKQWYQRWFDLLQGEHKNWIEYQASLYCLQGVSFSTNRIFKWFWLIITELYVARVGDTSKVLDWIHGKCYRSQEMIEVPSRCVIHFSSVLRQKRVL